MNGMKSECARWRQVFLTVVDENRIFRSSGGDRESPFIKDWPRLPNSNPRRRNERVEDLRETEQPDSVTTQLVRLIAGGAHAIFPRIGKSACDGDAVRKRLAATVHEFAKVFRSKAARAYKHSSIEIIFERHFS